MEAVTSKVGEAPKVDNGGGGQNSSGGNVGGGDEYMFVVDNGGGCNDSGDCSGDGDSSDGDIRGDGGCIFIGDGDNCGGFLRRPPPPFLKKIYEMVDDPQTDELISWSVSRKSFVIWDHLKFSSNLLSRYFKHNNFSSFLYQLNVYGFKKVDLDRWEYANEWFQAEKKHLLKNIKRRKQHSPSVQRKPAPTTSPDHHRRRHRSLEAELKILRDDQKALKTEVLNLKRRQESTDGRLAAIDESFARTADSDSCKQRETFILMAKAFASPEFLRQFVECMRMGGELINGEIVTKKQRLVVVPPPWTDSSEAARDSASNGCKNSNSGNGGGQSQSQSQEEQKTLTVATPGSAEVSSGEALDFNSENRQQPSLPLVEDDEGSSSRHQKTYGVSGGETDPAVTAEDFILLGKLLEDDFVNEIGGENDQVAPLNQPKIVLEPEDLMEKPTDWAAYVKELMQQSGLS